MKYNKLVRDKIPEIIEDGGTNVITHIASDDEYQQKLHEKLLEEVEEYLESHRTEELADILEVLYALCKIQNLSWEDLEKTRKEKAEERGAFTKHIILDETIDE